MTKLLSINGQWFGAYSGTNGGTIALELDRFDDDCRGNVFAYDTDPRVPSVAAPVQIPLNTTKFTLELPLFPIDPQSGDFTNWSDLEKSFPEFQPAKMAETQWELAGDTIDVSWSTDVGRAASAHLPKAKHQIPQKSRRLSITGMSFLDT